LARGHFIQQLFTALFLVNCANLSELVRTGRLDFSPVAAGQHAVPRLVAAVDLGAFVNAASAVAVIAYAARQLSLTPTRPKSWASCRCAASASSSTTPSCSCWPPSVLDSPGAGDRLGAYYNLFNVARLPDSAFRPGVFKAVFTFALPMLLVSNVPVKLLNQKLESPFEILLLLVLAGACFLASEWMGGRRAPVHQRQFLTAG